MHRRVRHRGQEAVPLYRNRSVSAPASAAPLMARPAAVRGPGSGRGPHASVPHWQVGVQGVRGPELAGRCQLVHPEDVPSGGKPKV